MGEGAGWESYPEQCAVTPSRRSAGRPVNASTGAAARHACVYALHGLVCLCAHGGCRRVIAHVLSDSAPQVQLTLRDAVVVSNVITSEETAATVGIPGAGARPMRACMLAGVWRLQLSAALAWQAAWCMAACMAA